MSLPLYACLIMVDLIMPHVDAYDALFDEQAAAGESMGASKVLRALDMAAPLVQVG